MNYFFWNVPKQFPGMAAVPVPDDLAGFQTYNTVGLIPGPICTPTVASIDAALDPNTKTGYLYLRGHPRRVRQDDGPPRLRED